MASGLSAWWGTLQVPVQVALMSGIAGLLSGIIGGMLSPTIQNIFAVKTHRKQKLLEADLSRQTKLIDAQSKFLDDVTTALWGWRYTSARITRSGAKVGSDTYEKCHALYVDDIWFNLNNIRTLVSQSRRLSSRHAYERMLTFYQRIVSIDRAIWGLIDHEDNLDRAMRFAALNVDIINKVSQEIDELLSDLAKELGLAEPTT
jgi:hypothetical protein